MVVASVASVAWAFVRILEDPDVYVTVEGVLEIEGSPVGMPWVGRNEGTSALWDR